MATKAFGYNYDQSLVGWAKVSETAQPSGEATIVFRGLLTTLSSALTAIANDDSLIYDAVSVDTDEESGTATITLTKSATTTESKPSTSNGQVKNPTVSIQGSMLSPQLHQHPTFSTGDKPLTLSAIATTNYCLKTYGEVANADLERESETAITYAQWRSYGIDTYLAPSYTMTITYYISDPDKAKEFILEAGKVFTFNTVIKNLKEDLKPKAIDNVGAWLAQAPSINITSDGVTVSQAFIGAKAFPSFYASEDKTLVYDAPKLSDEYFYDLKHRRENSGTED